MSDAGLPYTLKSDLMIELPLPRRMTDSSDRFKHTFRQLTFLLDDIDANVIDIMNRQNFQLAVTAPDITGSEVSGMNKSDWDNHLERMKSTVKNDKDKLTRDDMTALRVEMKLRRVFLEQKRSPFRVITPSVIKSVERDRRSRPAAFAFGCKHLYDVRKFLHFELLLFLTEFCEEILLLLAENKMRSQRELMIELGLLQRNGDSFRAAVDVYAREQARQCYFEICLSIVKSAHTPLANNILRGVKNCADQINNLGLFKKKDTNANFSEFLKTIGSDDTKPERQNTNKITGGAYFSMSNKLQEVIRIVRYLHKLNNWSAFHVSKDVTKSLTTVELESLIFQSQKFKVIYTPVFNSQDNNTVVKFRVPQVLTTPDIIALVRRFDSKFCKLLSGKETDMNAYHSTYRDPKGNYQLFRAALAALTINRSESLSSELLHTANQRFKVGIALYDSWNHALEMKSVSNIVLHPKTTGTEGEFLTPAKVVSLFYTDYCMMTKADFEDDDNFLTKVRLAINADKGDEPANVTKDVNPKQQEAFMAAIQQYNNCLLRYDMNTSQKTIDNFNSSRQNTLERHTQRSYNNKSQKDMFDVLKTPLDCNPSERSTRNITAELENNDDPHVHLLFVPVLDSIVTFIQKRDEYDLFTDPLCGNSYVLTKNTCLALVAVDACDHTVYVYDPTSPNTALGRHERLLAILVAMLSMSVKFRKPYAISSASNLSSSYYTVAEAKSKKAWFEQLLQLAETMIRDYTKINPPMLYLNSLEFMPNMEYNIKYDVIRNKTKTEKGKSTPFSETEEKQQPVKMPVISAVLSCRYAEFLLDKWVAPRTIHRDARLVSSFSPDAFIKNEVESAGAGRADDYIENIVKRIFGSVFRVPTPYKPTQFGKKSNNKFNKGQGRGQGHSNRGRSI